MFIQSIRYDFFADLNLTSGISLNSFYWFLCDVGARPISYFFQFWSFGGAMGPQTGSKEPQIAQNCHSVPLKQVWCLQTGGTKWNKGGTSQGTSPVMQWNCFSGQGGPQTAQNGHFGAIIRSGVSKLVEQYETRVEQVRAHPG